MPKGSAHSVISPVVKDKSGDISDSANYRPIALVTIFSKILEHIIVSCVDKYLLHTINLVSRSIMVLLCLFLF